MTVEITMSIYMTVENMKVSSSASLKHVIVDITMGI